MYPYESGRGHDFKFLPLYFSRGQCPASPIKITKIFINWIKTSSKFLEPVTFEIIRHKLLRIVDEAIVALKKVSGSTITNEAHDLMVALYRSDGSLLMGGMGYLHHLTLASQACKHIINEYSKDPGIFEDDMFMLNDPYSASLHTPDVFVISPVHYHGELVAWSASFVHVADIGAINPGGFSPDATESFHEGFTTPGLKFVERGKIKLDVWKTFMNMIRDPSFVSLDMRSQIAANNVAKQRIKKLIDKYGLADVNAVSAELINQSELLLRRKLIEIPDGTWRARQYIDTHEIPLRVQLKITKSSDSLVYDFTGSSDQTAVPVNCTYWATWGAIFSPLLPLLCYDITWNEGVTRPVKMLAPSGTIVNCIKPAPVSVATVCTIKIVNNLSTLALSKMLKSSGKYREDSTGVWLGGVAPLSIYGLNRDRRFFVLTPAESMGGSGGARNFRDGIDLAGELTNSVSRWPNVESHELNAPILYLYRHYVRDSGGPGRYRGGRSGESSFIPYDSPEDGFNFTAYGNGTNFASSEGIFGGYPGCTIRYVIHRNGLSTISNSLDIAEGNLEEVWWGVYHLQKGDVLTVRWAGGGGYGDPIEREPKLVQDDVQGGDVSVQVAKDVYGVVTGPEEFENEKTIQQRELIRIERLNGKKPRPPRDNLKNLEAATQISDLLAVAKRDSGESYICFRCGNDIASLSESWKSKALQRVSSLSRVGPEMTSSGLFLLREFFCPSCAALLDTEVALKDDPFLDDYVKIP